MFDGMGYWGICIVMIGMETAKMAGVDIWVLRSLSSVSHSLDALWCCFSELLLDRKGIPGQGNDDEWSFSVWVA